jgi:hypothetical protein
MVFETISWLIAVYTVRTLYGTTMYGEIVMYEFWNFIMADSRVPYVRTLYGTTVYGEILRYEFWNYIMADSRIPYVRCMLLPCMVKL